MRRVVLLEVRRLDSAVLEDHVRGPGAHDVADLARVIRGVDDVADLLEGKVLELLLRAVVQDEDLTSGVALALDALQSLHAEHCVLVAPTVDRVLLLGGDLGLGVLRVDLVPGREQVGAPHLAASGQ